VRDGIGELLKIKKEGEDRRGDLDSTAGDRGSMLPFVLAKILVPDTRLRLI
jgi:hypothetical protein